MHVTTLLPKVLAATATCLLWGFLLRPAAMPALSEGLPFRGPPAPYSAGGWVDMPAGARPTYIGIHGGTVPVSLLTSRDGQSMVTFVGRTGNDFLRILQKTSIQPPMDTDAVPVSLANNATVLMADTPIGSIPVFYATGKGFARMDLAGDQWLPFGLTEKPLLLEGQAVRPLEITGTGGKAKKFRRMLLMHRLQRPVLSTR